MSHLETSADSAFSFLLFFSDACALSVYEKSGGSEEQIVLFFHRNISQDPSRSVIPQMQIMHFIIHDL